MKVLVEEYFDFLLTIICGLIIIAIVVSSVVTTSINIEHNEDAKYINLRTECIDTFSCKDVIVSKEEYEKLRNKVLKKDSNEVIFKNVKALSNSGIDIGDNIKARIVEENDKKYVLYVLSYFNDYRIMKTKCYLEEDIYENNV